MKTMKIMRRLMGCAAAILALTACSESEDLLAAYHSDSKAVHITAQVGKASADGFTRSNPLGTAEEQAKFNDGDMISVKAEGQDAVTYKFVEKAKEWQPQDGKFLKWEKETMNFTAYYPASIDGTITQPMEYESEADLAAADFMSFTGNVTNSGNNSLTLTMERKMARVVVEIAGFNDQYTTDATVKSVTINGNIKAYKHSDNKFYALINPNSIPGATAPFLTLEVEDGTSKTTETLTTTPSFAAGKSYTYKLKVGKNKISVSGITVAPWNTGTITEGSKAEHIIPYVTFKANGKQTFQMTAVPDYEISGLEYSVNNDEKWRKVEKDGKISFGGEYGDLRLRGTNHNGTAKDESYYSTIKFTDETVNVACTGDIRTLLDWKNYNIVKTDNARFCSLFETCSVLTSAPELPATKLANCCYYYMFYKCTNLTSAPVLPATILAQECYSNMFTECTNLTSAPELPATKLAVHCYYSMFSNCPKLSSVTMLAPKSEIETKNNCVLNWLDEAGNDASVTTRTLKVQDEAAYKALENKTAYLPDIWKKGATGTTVVDENNAEINIE